MPASTPRSRLERNEQPGRRRPLQGDGSGVTEVIGAILVFGILSMVLLLSLVAFGVAQDAATDRAIEIRAESAAARVAGVVVDVAVMTEQASSGSLAVAYPIDLPQDLEGRAYSVLLVKKESRSIAGVSATAGTRLLDSTGGSFTAADLCRTVAAPGVPSGTIIISVISATRVELSSRVTQTSSGAAGTVSSSDQVCVMVPSVQVIKTAPLFSASAPTTVNLCSSQAAGGKIHVRFHGANVSPIPATCLADDIFLKAPT